MGDRFRNNPSTSTSSSSSSGEDSPSTEDSPGCSGLGKAVKRKMDEVVQPLDMYSSVANKMMRKMGYQPGTGLGREKQGRVDIVPASEQRGRRGLGLKIKALNKDVVIDWEDEKPPSAEEVVDWFPPYDGGMPEKGEMEAWADVGKKKLVIDDETLFCDNGVLKTVLECKSIFDDLEGQEMRKARMRSNPYETIRGGIFLNRAAMKMANMDSILDFMFTQPKCLGNNEILYFADVCAGPGGFSEYILWKKKWRAKGFGFTLKGPNDFKLGDFFAANSEFFEPHYGVNGIDGNGDIMNTSNLEEFQDFVLTNTNEKGVHFVMADGGFSVEGQENIQEILTKQLLMCQIVCALSILRVGGNFVLKTFDLFTPFSNGLIYLLRIAFENVAIYKPVTSRPANSERYAVCQGYRDEDRQLFNYLIEINDQMNEFKKSSVNQDVKAVVPLEILTGDQEFFNYMKTSNESIAKEQCKGLAKIHAFTKDRSLRETKQAQVRLECLKKWQVPDRVRSAPQKTDVSSLFYKLTGLKEPHANSESKMLTSDNLLSSIRGVFNYKCYVSSVNSSILVSMGGSYIFLWNKNNRRWLNLTQLKCLIPRDTILEVEIAQELKGESKGQHRVTTIHIVDALFLAGDDMRALNYAERMQSAAIFAEAIRKPSCKHLNLVRTKEIFRLEDAGKIFTQLKLKTVKGGGSIPRPCYEITNSDLCFVPRGIVFVRTSQDPWSMEYSRSQNRKYFFNMRTNESVFECPPDFNAPYDICSTSRLIWEWRDGVKVHPDQQHHRVNNISTDQLLNFVRSKLPH
nr:cap-specific mRNA (nucleoside-2'-O-)-methyltransferase 1 [Ciona intestinalis]|eukprot:XP_002121619.3 cap-specific mRNA (nucleoside-2'-O-)-methyltransferase 1 [Ciona intestinalis]